MPNSFVSETELPGRRIDSDTLEIIAHRYYWASEFVHGKEILEVGCGPGLGLGWLSRHAEHTIGGDITLESIVLAKKHYGPGVELARLDAHKLPFRDNSIDVVVCVAAIIYMDLPVFLEECYRVLSKGGTLAINTPNKDQPGFRESLLSRKYYSVPELHSQLQRRGFEVEFFGAFPVRQNTAAIWSRVIGRPSLFRLRKFAASALRLLGLYEAVTQLGCSGTAAITLTEELKEEDIKLVQGIQLVPLSCNIPDLKHRIVYAVAQAR